MFEIRRHTYYHLFIPQNGHPPTPNKNIKIPQKLQNLDKNFSRVKEQRIQQEKVFEVEPCETLRVEGFNIGSSNRLFKCSDRGMPPLVIVLENCEEGTLLLAEETLFLAPGYFPVEVDHENMFLDLTNTGTVVVFSFINNMYRCMVARDGIPYCTAFHQFSIVQTNRFNFSV